MNLLPWGAAFVLYFGLTLLLEAPVYWLALNSRSAKERVVVWFTANAISYPPVFFLFAYLPFSALTCELVSEVWAPLCEIAVAWFLLGRLSAREQIMIVGANLISWWVGKALILLLMQRVLELVIPL